jgi:hypothetical protein
MIVASGLPPISTVWSVDVMLDRLAEHVKHAARPTTAA